MKRIKEQMQSSDAASVPFLMTVTGLSAGAGCRSSNHPVTVRTHRSSLFNLDKPIYFRNRFIGQFVCKPDR